MAVSIEKERLQFIFTKDTFLVDQPDRKLMPLDENRKKAFLTDRYRALFEIGFEEESTDDTPTVLFLREVSAGFITALTELPELELAREYAQPILSEDISDRLLGMVPYGLGTEYIDRSWILRIFEQLRQVYSQEIQAYEGTVAMFLMEKNQHLKVPERVFFHLVESRDEMFPFAFLATYATKDKNGKIRHMPLSYALTEFKNERDRLITLLSCLNRAAEVSTLIGNFVESGEMFHPLKITSEEAYELLKSVPALESCGILCRIPDWWKKKYYSVSMNVKLGEEASSVLGFDTLVSMTPELTVGGERLTHEEIQELLKQTDGLAYLKGKWVEVNHAKLADMLNEMDKYHGSMSLLDAIRVETGMKESPDLDAGVKISNGTWLSDMLSSLRRPASMKKQRVPVAVQAELRPYQKTGYSWLFYMMELGFGACLADDMGLGKTLQVLTLLERIRKKDKNARVLLIVPASLVGNWEKETTKFTPKIEYRILHGKTAKILDEEVKNEAAFLNITTYGMAARIEAFREINWDCLILDEAQAIKNPGTKQTRNIKKIPARQKIAMTGTPIENDLTNLWSLFDFLNKGLLGTSGEFREYAKQLGKHQEDYQKLKNMVSPFILRRLKTDKTIISDLPDKLEQLEYVNFSKKQVVLYRKQVSELEKSLSEKTGMERRGLVLATILKLKQICNHPDQFMGQEVYDPKESGKFELLRELCETIYEKRERVLIFTQYREITDYLSRFLTEVFGSRGLVLHGGTRVKKRAELVEQFNGESYVPYMVLSVKAGGTGLNLTAANHVIHFDRWWNPSVENQATDRAFRIGQKKNVIVHKLVSKGTIEEKIDEMINSKKELADNVIGSGGENWITELSDQELLGLMKLEI